MATMTLDDVLKLDLDALNAETNFHSFYKEAWPIVEPGTEFLDNWHIECISEHLEACSKGEIGRLLINVPPRSGKSNQVSVCWPVWNWIRNPQSKWMFVSYSSLLATHHSVMRRNLINSSWFRRRWGRRFKMAEDQNLKAEFVNDKRGHMLALGMGGSSTGKGADVVVADDAHNPEEAASDSVREGQVDFFRTSMTTRLNDKKNGKIVIVMQRLHVKDLSGYAIEQGYHHLCLPATVAERKVISIPGSKKKYIREAGSILWPEREDEAALASIKRQMGSFAYAGQYMQSPAPEGGGRFKTDNCRSWVMDDSHQAYFLKTPGGGNRIVPVDQCSRFATLDIAGTKKKIGNDPDYSVLQIWDITPDYDMVLVEQWRDRVETPELIRQVTRLCRQYEAEFLITEKNGLGLPIVQTIRQKGIAVRGIQQNVEKTIRAGTAEIRHENGAVYFPEHALWRADLEHELALWPVGQFDDQIDALALAASYVQRIGGAVKNDEDRMYAIIKQEEEKRIDGELQKRQEQLVPKHHSFATGDDEYEGAGWRRIL